MSQLQLPTSYLVRTGAVLNQIDGSYVIIPPVNYNVQCNTPQSFILSNTAVLFNWKASTTAYNLAFTASTLKLDYSKITGSISYLTESYSLNIANNRVMVAEGAVYTLVSANLNANYSRITSANSTSYLVDTYTLNIKYSKIINTSNYLLSPVSTEIKYGLVLDFTVTGSYNTVPVSINFSKFSFTLDASDFQVSTTTVNLKYKVSLSQVLNLNYSATDINFQRGYPIIPNTDLVAGSVNYTLTLKPVTIVNHNTFVLDTVAYSLSSTTTPVTKAITLALASASFSLTPIGAIATYNGNSTLAVASYTTTYSNLSILRRIALFSSIYNTSYTNILPSYQKALESSVYSINGYSTVIRRVLPLSSTSFTYNSNSLLYNYVKHGGLWGGVISSSALVFKFNRVLNLGSTSYSNTFNASSYYHNYTLSITKVSYSLSGNVFNTTKNLVRNYTTGSFVANTGNTLLKYKRVIVLQGTQVNVSYAAIAVSRKYNAILVKGSFTELNSNLNLIFSKIVNLQSITLTSNLVNFTSIHNKFILLGTSAVSLSSDLLTFTRKRILSILTASYSLSKLNSNYYRNLIASLSFDGYTISTSTSNFLNSYSAHLISESIILTKNNLNFLQDRILQFTSGIYNIQSSELSSYSPSRDFLHLVTLIPITTNLNSYSVDTKVNIQTI